MRKRWIAFLVGVLAVKLATLFVLHDHPLLQPRGDLDTAYYVSMALRVADGDSLDQTPFAVSPLYIYFLGAIFALTGKSLLAVKLVQILLGTIAVALIGGTAVAWFGERARWFAAGFAALTGLFTFFEVTILQAALDPFLVALSLWLAAGVLQNEGRLPYRGLACGLALGALALNRPNVLPWLGVFALLLFLTGRQALARTIPLLLGAAMAITPFTIRNYVVSGEAILISSHGGLNLYIGNNDKADGTYQSVAGITPNIQGQVRDARRVAEAAARRNLTVREVDDYFYAKAWEWIRERPGKALALLMRKLAYALNATDLSLNYSYNYYSRDVRSPLMLLVVGPALLIPLGAGGLVQRMMRKPRLPFAIWVSFLPVYLISVAMFFVSSRYRMPLLVPFSIGAGGFIDFALRERRRALPYAAIIIPLTVLALWNFGLDDGRSNERTMMVLDHLYERRFDDATALIEETAGQHPQPGVLFFRAGLAYDEMGELDRAIESYRRALQFDPEQPEIFFVIGKALTGAGRSPEAVPYLERALRTGSSPDRIRYELALALLGSGRPREARVILQQIDVDDRASLVALGQLALDLRDATLAIRFLEPAVRDLPNVAVAHHRLSLAYALAGRSDLALREMERAIQIDPSDPASHLNLAVFYAESDRIDEARRHAVLALELRPGYQEAEKLLRMLR